MLKSRLKDKILDFLTTDISRDKKDQLDEVDLAYISIKKMSAQYQQLYYAKNRSEITSRLLDSIIFLAKKFEYYSALAEHLKIKKNSIIYKSNIEEFEQKNSEIKKYLLYNSILLNAEHDYYSLMKIYDYEGTSNKEEAIAFLEKAKSRVQKGYEITKSPIVNYYLKMLEMDYYQLKGNYAAAKSICMELLNIVRDNRSVRRRQRIGVVYDNLSRCQYYLGQFEHAIESAQQAQQHFNHNSENYCIALEQEFYALFAMERYSEAEKVANKMLSSATRKELGEFRYAKYNFLLANTLFKLRRFNQALELLNARMEISKDKAGWEIGLRTLKIMTLVEMLKLDEAANMVRALKLFIIRTDKKTPVSPRDKKILNLLLVAERKGFMFSILNGTAEKYLSLLYSETEEYRWEPFTHEVIPFHLWFVGKVGNSSKSKTRIKDEKMPKGKETKKNTAVFLRVSGLPS